MIATGGGGGEGRGHGGGGGHYIATCDMFVIVNFSIYVWQKMFILRCSGRHN